jgi:hypothetical protein
MLKKINPLIIAILSIAFAGCSSLKEAPSSWNNNTLKIDGAIDDWAEDFYYFSEQNAIVGVKNDSEFLYLCLKVSNAVASKQILAGGLTLWLNNEGNKSETFGIQFPIGISDKDNPPGFRSDRDMPNRDDSGPDEMRKPQESSDGEINSKHEGRFSQERMAGMLDDIIIKTNEDEAQQKISTNEAKKKYRLSASLSVSGDDLIIEYAIPLNSKFADLDSKNTDNYFVGIGFVGGTVEMPKMNGSGMPPGGGRQGGGMGGGSMPPGGGRSGGGMPPGGGMQSGNMEQKSSVQPIELWFKSKIAVRETNTK